MVVQLKSKTIRNQLKPRREPYWQRISSGFFVGYRVLDSGQGTWIARLREMEAGKTKQKYQALREFDDSFDGNNFDEVVKTANRWLESRNQGVSKVNTTVDAACKTYVIHIKNENGAASSKDAEGRFKRLIYETWFGNILLSKLKTSEVRKWVSDQLAQEEDDDEEDLRKSKDSANRNLASLKAALNLALKDRLVATDAGWKTITPFRGVGRRREHLLTQNERAALLACCSEDLANLVKGLLLTGARPGELAKATVADFDKKQGTIVLNGKIGRRIATVSTAARTFFSNQAEKKLPNAPLLTNSFGNVWKKDDWKKPFKEAVRKAQLPDNIVMYHLRHAAISEMILAGMQSSIVAMLAGTSTAMIDKHYGHLQHVQTRQMLDAFNMV